MSDGADPDDIDGTNSMRLEYEMRYTLTAIRGQLTPTAGSPLVSSGRCRRRSSTARGFTPDRRCPGRLMLDAGDGYGRPDVRLAFTTDDGETVLLHYTGLVEQSAAFTDAASNDRSTSFHDHYMRMALQFDTGTTRYRWLTQSLFTARGRLLGTNAIEHEVFHCSERERHRSRR